MPAANSSFSSRGPLGSAGANVGAELGVNLDLPALSAPTQTLLVTSWRLYLEVFVNGWEKGLDHSVQVSTFSSGGRSSPKCPSVFSQIPAPHCTGPPLPRSPSTPQIWVPKAISCHAVSITPQQGVQCLPVNELCSESAALVEVESWGWGGFRTRLPRRNNEALPSRIRYQDFALLTLRRLCRFMSRRCT